MMSFRDRFTPGKRRKSTTTQRVGFAFFWMLVLFYAYFIPTGPNWNAESHLYLTFSIVDHHSVIIDHYQKVLGDKSYNRGHYYSDKAPGISFLAIPPYAALRLIFGVPAGAGYHVYPHRSYALDRGTSSARFIITFLILAIPSALFSVLLWLFFTKLTGNQVWALLVTGVYALGTIAYEYSTQLFSHQISAILLFGSFLLIFAHVRQASLDRHLVGACLLAGLLSGYAIICEYPTVAIAFLIGVYLLLVARKKLLSALAFIAGMIPPAILNLAYNTLAFGSPVSIGYTYDTYEHSQRYQAHVHGAFGFASVVSKAIQPFSWSSLWEITFGTYRGIFLVSPVLLLFVVGLIFMWHKRDLHPELGLCAAVVVLYFIMDASRSADQLGWSGGVSVASRHLTPILPFMMLPLVFGASNRVFRVAFLALGSLSIGIMFLIVAVGSPFSIAERNPLAHIVLPLVLHGEIAPNWGFALDLRHFASLVPLGVVVLCLVARIVWLFHDQRATDMPSRESAVYSAETG